jgi:thiamine-phosphate diphosphorylase
VSVSPDSLRLVVLIDVAPGGEWKPDLLAAVLRGGATLVQLRGKEVGARALLEAARSARPACRERNVPLVVNDRPDVARAAGADGVHVGPSDLPPRAARTIIETGILGVSARTPDRVRLAEEAGADYLGVGALHPSPTKPEAHVLGPEGIRTLIQSTSLPVVVIGGVTPADLPHLRTLGAAGVAAHSGIVDAPDPESATRAYHTAWGS